MGDLVNTASKQDAMLVLTNVYIPKQLTFAADGKKGVC